LKVALTLFNLIISKQISKINTLFKNNKKIKRLEHLAQRISAKSIGKPYFKPSYFNLCLYSQFSDEMIKNKPISKYN
jgi:hypothetical protein